MSQGFSVDHSNVSPGLGAHSDSILSDGLGKSGQKQMQSNSPSISGDDSGSMRTDSKI